jgi:WD40 repeat protein
VVCLLLLAAAPALRADVQTRFLQQYGLGTLQGCSAYSPDGQFVVTGGASGAVEWNVEAAEVVRIFRAQGHYVYSVALSPDGTKLLTGGDDKTAKLWNAFTGAEIRTFSGHTLPIRSVAFSPDGTKVLTGSGDRTARLWDIATGDAITSFAGHLNVVSSVVFSPDGTKVLTGSGSTTRLSDIATGDAITTFTGNPGAFSPDGTKVLTVDASGLATLRDAATSAVIWMFPFHPWGNVNSVAFSPDGTKVLTASNDRTAKLWDALTGFEMRSYNHSATVGSAAFSPDGTKVFTRSGDQIATLWDADAGTVIRTFSGHTSNVNSVAFSPDGTKALTGSTDNTAKLWDLASGTMMRTFSGHTADVYSVAFSPDGTKVLTGSWESGATFDWTARLWDAATGVEIQTFFTPALGVRSVAFSPDGTEVLTGHPDKTARLWDIATGTEIRMFSGHMSGVFSVAFSPDGTKVLTGSDDKTARLWNAATGDAITTFSGHTLAVNSVAFSPDGTKVLTGSGDKTARLWNAATGDAITTFSGHATGVRSVAFSPDGTKVLTGSGDETAKLWDTATGAEVRTFSGHMNLVSSVAFSPDGTKVLTGSTDGTTMLWELNPPRAIIVAGGGDFAENAIGQQTDALGAYAFKTLKARGYEALDVQYLSAFGPLDPMDPSRPFRDADGDGLNDMDSSATLAQLQSAITGQFAQQAGRLLIIMIDHGYRTQDFMAFRANETQVLPSTTLRSWLDNLQTSYPVDVTLVMDACYSGKMLEDCSGAPPGRMRTIIASTAGDTEAIFLAPPDLTSFIHTFLGSAYMGNSFGEAWRAGQRFFETFPVANQVPQIDDGTTGTGLADREFFGVTWTYGVQSTQDINQFFPAFDSWTTDKVVAPGTPVTLWTRMLPGQTPLDVQAVIRPPAPGVISGEPVTNLPRVSLQPKVGDPALWEAVTTDTFAAAGRHAVSFTARFPSERISNPVFSHVTISSGFDPDATPIRAILAIGETNNTLLSSAFQGLAAYAYRVYLDRFQDDGGYRHPEWIEYLTPFLVPDRDAAPGSAGVISRIDTLPPTIGCLYVHLIGESDGPGGVKLASGDTLSATALDTALDALQSRQDCTVVLAVDAPYSGSFLGTCHATGLQKRVVMASGRAGDGAFFLPRPTLSSFTQKFLGAGFQGNSLLDSFLSGRGFLRLFLNSFLGLRIEPQLDDNGDGVYNVLDGALARTLCVGRRYAFAGDEASGLPFILDVTTTQTAPPGTIVSYAVQLIDGIAPDRVFALLVPPDSGGSGEVVATLPEIEFTRTAPGSSTWSATFSAPATPGLYGLTVFASYSDFPDNKLSEPAFTGLQVQGGTGVRSWIQY